MYSIRAYEIRIVVKDDKDHIEYRLVEPAVTQWERANARYCSILFTEVCRAMIEIREYSMMDGTETVVLTEAEFWKWFDGYSDYSIYQ